MAAHVVFVAPHFLENTNRYVRAFAALDGVTLSVISMDPSEAIPAELKPRIAGHYKIDDSMDAAQLETATRAITKSIGKVDRLAGVLEQLQTPLAAVRDAVGIEGVTRQLAQNFRDKDRMKEVLRASNVPVAKSTLARSADDLRAFVDQVGYPVIVKPQAGLGSRATYRVENATDLAAIQAPTPGSPIQVEEFVRAREHTCETVTIKGVPVWRSGTRYFPSPLEVLETAWVQYCVLLPREADDPTWTNFAATNTAALTALFADKVNTAAGTALTHMEWFLREDGTSLVNEVGVRPPGVQIMPLMSIAHDMNMFSEWARLQALDEFHGKPRVRAAGSAFFRGQGNGTRIVEVKGVEKAIEQCGDALVELRAPKVGMARAESYEGEGWGLVKHDTTEGAKTALLALIENIQVRYG
jgi:phosphoribosylaminoimidazole carboxylase (NCAIR synthetase)